MTDRLSALTTWWTLLQEAHSGSPDKTEAAQRLLVERYHPVVYRYLQGITGDADMADELTQEFGLSLLSKKFQRANQSTGRFRDYVKTVLRNLVHKHFKQEKRQPKTLEEDIGQQPASVPADSVFDREFLRSWREQLLARAWEALEQTQPQYYRVLRFRADNPDMKSAEMAKALSEQFDESLTADNVRQILRRARRQFGDLLLHEAACSLEPATAEAVEDELQDLRLLDYCQEALQRYRAAK